jgi:hypothetical protein
MLSTYLTAVPKDRDRLLARCGSVLSQDLDWIALLMLPGRQHREATIAATIEVVPILSLLFSQAWGVQPSINRRLAL